MHLLLTARGITNESIKNALVGLLGKQISKSSALFIPTAIYAYEDGTKFAWQGIKELTTLGWKDFGILELTSLTSLPKDVWLPQIQAIEALIVGGGNGFYLSYWMEKSGLYEMLPDLLKSKVYVGISAGSMILTPRLNYDLEKYEKTRVYYDDEYDESMSARFGSSKTLQVVDFEIRPHLNTEYFPRVTLKNVKKWATKTKTPMYAIDDQTAIKVVNDKAEIVSEGKWNLFNQLPS